MLHRPPPNEFEGRSRLNVADHHLTAEVELALLPLMLGVEMRRFMFSVKHPNDDAKERGDDRHAAVYRRLTRRDLDVLFQVDSNLIVGSSAV